MNAIDMDVVRDILSDYGTVKVAGGLPYVHYEPNADRFAIVAQNDRGSFTITPVDSYDTRLGASVEVYAPSPWESSATVNWPSTGARSPAETRLFGQMLDIAADLATKVTAKRGVPA
jgi:hypothetical protein